GDVADPHLHDAMGRQPGDLRAVEQDATRWWLEHAHDGLERRRLAGAIAPQQRDGLSGVDGERDVLQDVAQAVIPVDALDAQHVAHLRCGGESEARPGSAGACRTLGAWGPFRGPMSSVSKIHAPEARHGSAGACRTLGAWGPFRGPHVISLLNTRDGPR